MVRGGHVVFRQIAATKDDRLTAEQLLAAVDRSLGTTGPAATRVTPLDRVQLRVDLGGGARAARSGAGCDGTVSEWCGLGTASIAGLVPLGHHLVVGPWLAADTSGHVDIDGAALLRVPILGDAGAITLGATAGGGTHENVAARVGLWFAWSPHYAASVDAAYRVEAGDRDFLFTVGIARLFGQ